jgi:hypothetical protein
MSQIFYSQVDTNLQQELLRRAGAGKTDRSETALRYMTEKIANAQVTVTPNSTINGVSCSGSTQQFTITVNPTPNNVLPGCWLFTSFP